MREAEPAAPVEPKPAASVILVRTSARGAPEPLEAYMIRRHQGMKFLGGFYAFPGGKVDPHDGSAAAIARCHGLDADAAAACFASDVDVPPLAFWVTAVRELLEETGVLLACDGSGRPIDPSDPAVAAAVTEARKALLAGATPFADILARAGWRADLRPLRYLSHFVTPRTSPIRFTARFFLCRVPAGQRPSLFTEETSEAFWIHPGEGWRRFMAGEMAMAEPGQFSLGYLAQFRSLEELWAAQDGREKFCGIIDRIEFWQSFDWKQNRWKQNRWPG